MDSKSRPITMMNILKHGLLVGLLLGLVGCGDFWDESYVGPEADADVDYQTDLEPEPDSEPKPEPRRDLVLNEEELSDSLFIGVVAPNEIIEVHLTGTKFTPQFTDIYERSFRSKWTATVCPPPPFCSEPRPDCPIIHSSCYNESRRGECIHRYRDQLQEKSAPLVFDQAVVDVSAKLKIGDNTFYLGEIVQNHGLAIVTRFQVSKEMLIESDEVFLVATPEPSKGRVKVGFQGFGRCQGEGQRSFNSGGSTRSSNVHDRERIEYNASVIIEHPIEAQ